MSIEVTALLLLLMGVLIVLSRKLGQRDKLHSCITLTAQHRLHVVEFEGQRWMVGTGPAGAPRLLCNLDAAAATRESSSASEHTGESPA